MHESAFECNRWYSRLGAAVMVALPDLNNDELVFDPEPIYDACLGHEWFLTLPEALSEAMSKLNLIWKSTQHVLCPLTHASFLLTTHVLRLVLCMTSASRWLRGSCLPPCSNNCTGMRPHRLWRRCSQDGATHFLGVN